MRPTRIEVEGFSVYRERVVVDFEGVDFFSLAGPTGSGKSSLIDAMVFALYGRVPRLGGNAVAPAITAGADRARVRLDFDVGGETFTAVRMAQRTPSGGASVKEARLQQGDQVLADGADDVTTAVESLLRLRFDDFTRTVVLPQGDFARFLTATKSERQGLLRNLLGLDVYTAVRELARSREAVAKERIEAATRALDALSLPDEESAERARDLRENLERLAATIDDRERELESLDRDVEALESEDGVLADAVERLHMVEAPAGLDAHESVVAEARSDLVDAEEALGAIRKDLVEAEEHRAALPSLEEVRSWEKARLQFAAIDDRLGAVGLEDAEASVAATLEVLHDAEQALVVARRATLEARLEHSAHELAAGLVTGDSCPVCAREIVDLPERSDSPVIVDHEEAETALDAEVERARAVADEAKTKLAATESTAAELRRQRESFAVDLESVPDEKEIDQITESVGQAVTAVQAKRDLLRQREVEHEKAAERLADLAESSRQISKKLMTARDSVAGLGPPVPESDDPAVQWKELTAWRDRALQDQLIARERLAGEISKARALADDRRLDLVRSLTDAGLEAAKPYAVLIATELQTARTTVESHEKALAESTTLAEKIEDGRDAASVAGALVNHLRADGFERWLMVGALVDLVAGANQLLGELSSGGYSLHTDDTGEFSIIDHRNADERRSVATLSGGETFLVSLALALSLAETLAAKGGSDLDAIILDEGFGTLDDDSLDIVASVLEELTGSGLMVGVITHVKELAARAPVRYEVTREARGAAVRSIS